MQLLNSTLPRTMQCAVLAAAVTLGMNSWALADPIWGDLDYTPFSEMQAVNDSGEGTWSVPIPLDDPPGTNPDSDPGYKLWGVVLNNPGDMLDSTADNLAGYDPPKEMGGQWQVYIQTLDHAQRPAELAGDFGGAALWIGQNYGTLDGYPFDNGPHPTDSYTDDDWDDEVNWVSLNQTLKAGDLIKVHARGGLFYKGKFNANEEHDIDPAVNFDVFVEQAGFIFDVNTLAETITLAETTTLSHVKNPDNTFNFQQDRQSGAEHYQATLVKIEDVTVQDPGNADWRPDGTVTIVEVSSGLTLDMKLGLDPNFGIAAPAGSFPVIGIFDQEAGGGWPPDCTSGYRLWVMDSSQFDGLSRVPEPSSVLLAICGLAGLLLFATRKRLFGRK